MATTANWAATPRFGGATATTGDTARSGTPTSPVTVFTAGASGSRIDQIDLVAIGTTVASTLRLWIYDGSAYWLWKEIPVLAITPGSGVVVWSASIASMLNSDQLPLLLPASHSLRATVNDTQTASGINVLARGGDF